MDDDFGAEDDVIVDESAFQDDSESFESKVDYVILEESELVHKRDELVSDVASVLDVPPQTASMLLRSHGWNKEKFLQRVLDNKNKVLTESGLQYLGKKITEPSGSEFECRICDENVPSSNTLAIGCQHRFCNSCWKDYLTDRANSGKQAILSPCPSFKCPTIVPDSVFFKILPSELSKKYEKQILRSFVEDNRKMRWCPAPGCERAIEMSNSLITTVACKCGFKFCFKCGEEDHAPASCKMLQQWLDKCKNESETAHWIMANTKKCPKCLVRIEKNQGCNHMTCRSCKHEFCWVCDGSWVEHGPQSGGFYKCNKYDPKAKLRDTKGVVDSAKAELDRYLHYYQRYHNHDQSKKFAEKQRVQTEKRMAELHDKQSSSASASGAALASASSSAAAAASVSSWIDVQFLKTATEQVFECRRVLKYTYVFAYYLQDQNEKKLFEFLQQQLETTTEHLSELSEMDVSKMNRTEVSNYTGVTAKFMKNLLDGVANGLTATA